MKLAKTVVINDLGHQTIVPMHNKDLGKGLEDTILKQAGLK